MKTTEHGIEESKDVENIHHMRLMALLQELVREKGYKGAARVLEIDPADGDGQRQDRAAHAAGAPGSLERALQEGVGSAAERQRKRNEQLEGAGRGRGRRRSRAWRARSRRWARRRAGGCRPSRARSRPLRRDDPQGDRGRSCRGRSCRRRSAGGGFCNAVGRPVRRGRDRKPPSKPSMRREYPDLATREPAPDDEEIFGEAWPLIVEWRGLKDAHPNDGKGPATG